MSLENTKRIAEEAQHALEGYSRFLSETVNQLSEEMQRSWHDDVGQRASKSLRCVTRDWYAAVSDGIGGVSSALQTIQKIYSEISALEKNADAAARSAEI